MKVKSFSRVQLFVIPWTAAYQAPPSMGFSRQEYWSGVPLPSPYVCINMLIDHLLFIHCQLSSLRRRQWHPTPGLLPGKSHGRRSLVGCSPWDHEESDMTQRLHFHFSLSRIGEGNGNSLQRSCLNNPRDGGAWWAAIYGVAQSRTRLKRLSSRSSKQLFGFHIDSRASEMGAY